MAKIKITLVKSKIGSDKTQVGTIQALGLKKTNSSVEKEATPQILGMKVAKKVQVHLDTILEELQTLDEPDRGIDVEELLVQLKHVLDILQSDEKGGNHYE